MPEKLPPPAECANCGAAIPRSAKACPECGADERTGWRETSLYDDLDLPETAYEEPATADRARRQRERSVNGIAWYWWCVGVALVIFLALGVLALR
jgi:hypothetical protein